LGAAAAAVAVTPAVAVGVAVSGTCLSPRVEAARFRRVRADCIERAQRRPAKHRDHLAVFVTVGDDYCKAR